MDDVNGVEQVNVVALGGADTLTVNDLSGTNVAQVKLDLAGTLGGGTGDGQADTVDRQWHESRRIRSPYSAAAPTTRWRDSRPWCQSTAPRQPISST